MKWRQEFRSGVAVAFLEEGLDLQTAREFGLLFEGLASQNCRRIVLDLAGVPFIDSHSLAMIIGQAIHLRKLGGDVKLSRVPQAILRIFELVRMKEILEFYPDLDEAVRSFGETAPA